MRIGIYGGSFNPVHNGHIHLAETAAAELELDRLYLLPSKKSPHRSSAEYAPDEDRLSAGNSRRTSCSCWWGAICSCALIHGTATKRSLRR